MEESEGAQHASESGVVQWKGQGSREFFEGQCPDRGPWEQKEEQPRVGKVGCVQQDEGKAEKSHSPIVKAVAGICYINLMKLKLLWASPLPPTPSGVSDYAVEILGSLSQGVEIRVLRPPGQDEILIPEGLEVLDRIDGRRPGEILLLHLGNNTYHEWIMPLCREERAVVVMHDLVLHHLLVEHTAGRGRFGELEAALEQEYGETGRALAEGRRFGLGGRLDAFLFPALKSVVGGASAFISHSHFGVRRLKRAFPQRSCAHVPLPVADPGELDGSVIRAKMGVLKDEILLMHLGFLSREKGLATILEAVAAGRKLGLPLRLLIIGGTTDLGKAGELISALSLERVVSATGWLEKEEMMRLPAAADLGIVLREPSAGETSAAVLRFLAAGTPAAVIASHQYLEWPGEIAPRVSPGPASAADILRLLKRVCYEKKNGLWEKNCRQTRRYYLQHHRPEHATGRIVDFLSRLSF